MSSWADERRQGPTNSPDAPGARPRRGAGQVPGGGRHLHRCLVVLAARKWSILLWLGAPDLGIIVATYLGYWLMGVMLIAVGDGGVAAVVECRRWRSSSGCSSAGVPIFLGLLASGSGGAFRRQLEDLSVPAQFHDFGTGVVPLAGLVYFLSLAAGFSM